MRLASTTSNGGSPLGRLPARARRPAARAGCGGRWRASPRRRSGRCRRRAPSAAPSCSGGDRQDPRAAADVEDARAGERARGRRAPRARPGTAASSGGGRSRRPCPGRARGRRRPGRGRWRRQVGRMTSRRPTRRTGKCAFQASAQSSSWTIRVRSSPIGRRPNACRWPSASATLGRGALGGRAVARGHVGADDRRPGRVDAARPGPRRRARTRARRDVPPRRDPAEDLADRLDRLEVGLDRELEPGAAARRRSAIAPSSAQPRPSFSTQPAAASPTASPDSSA